MEMSCQLYAAVGLPPEEDVGTHWIGVWVGPRTGLNAVEERKICFPYLKSNPGRPVRRYTD
jgi:hypothetical protein